MKNKLFEIVARVIVIAIAALILYGLLMADKDCTDAGGTLVRGPYWYECVEGLR